MSVSFSDPTLSIFANGQPFVRYAKASTAGMSVFKGGQPFVVVPAATPVVPGEMFFSTSAGATSAFVMEGTIVPVISETSFDGKGGGATSKFQGRTSINLAITDFHDLGSSTVDGRTGAVAAAKFGCTAVAVGGASFPGWYWETIVTFGLRGGTKLGGECVMNDGGAAGDFGTTASAPGLHTYCGTDDQWVYRWHSYIDHAPGDVRHDIYQFSWQPNINALRDNGFHPGAQIIDVYDPFHPNQYGVGRYDEGKLPSPAINPLYAGNYAATRIYTRYWSDHLPVEIGYARTFGGFVMFFDHMNWTRSFDNKAVDADNDPSLPAPDPTLFAPTVCLLDSAGHSTSNFIIRRAPIRTLPPFASIQNK